MMSRIHFFSIVQSADFNQINDIKKERENNVYLLISLWLIDEIECDLLYDDKQ